WGSGRAVIDIGDRDGVGPRSHGSEGAAGLRRAPVQREQIGSRPAGGAGANRAGPAKAEGVDSRGRSDQLGRGGQSDRGGGRAAIGVGDGDGVAPRSHGRKRTAGLRRAAVQSEQISSRATGGAGANRAGAAKAERIGARGRSDQLGGGGQSDWGGGRAVISVGDGNGV